MNHLVDFAHLFEMSSRMQSIATALHRSASGEIVAASDDRLLQWVRGLLQQVELHPSIESGISAEMSVEATEIAPFFYNAVINCLADLGGVGVSTEHDIIEFLTRTVSGDERVSPEPEQLRVAAKLFDQLSNLLLNRLDPDTAVSNPILSASVA